MSSYVANMTLGEWYDHLSRHDWTFQYSEDHKAWLRGRDSENIIHNTLDYTDNPAYRDLYERFVAWKYDAEGDVMKPERPE